MKQNTLYYFIFVLFVSFLINLSNQNNFQTLNSNNSDKDNNNYNSNSSFNEKKLLENKLSSERSTDNIAKQIKNIKIDNSSFKSVNKNKFLSEFMNKIDRIKIPLTNENTSEHSSEHTNEHTKDHSNNFKINKLNGSVNANALINKSKKELKEIFNNGPINIPMSFLQTKVSKDDKVTESEKRQKELIKRLEEEVKIEEKMKEKEKVLTSINIANDDETTEPYKLPPHKWAQLHLNKKTKTPFQRQGHTSVIADTFMVVFGGCFMDRKCFNDVNFLDLR